MQSLAVLDAFVLVYSCGPQCDSFIKAVALNERVVVLDSTSAREWSADLQIVTKREARHLVRL